MSISDYLDEYFESEITKAHLSRKCNYWNSSGPCSPGSAYVLLHHYMGEVDGSVGSWGYARGGMGSITKAMMGMFKKIMGEVKPSSEVTNVIVKNGRAVGVATTKW
jgi:phytoene dehydrogenase-like protein